MILFCLSTIVNAFRFINFSFLSPLRNWSLIMGGGGYKMERGVQVRFYPYKKRGRKGFSHAEGVGYKKLLGLYFCHSLKF